MQHLATRGKFVKELQINHIENEIFKVQAHIYTMSLKSFHL